MGSLAAAKGKTAAPSAKTAPAAKAAAPSAAATRRAAAAAAAAAASGANKKGRKPKSKGVPIHLILGGLFAVLVIMGTAIWYTRRTPAKETPPLPPLPSKTEAVATDDSNEPETETAAAPTTDTATVNAPAKPTDPAATKAEPAKEAKASREEETETTSELVKLVLADGEQADLKALLVAGNDVNGVDQHGRTCAGRSRKSGLTWCRN